MGLPRLREPGPDGDIRTGMICSAAFHLLVVILAVFGLPHILPPPPEVEVAVPIEIAQISDKSNPAPRQVKAPEPVEKPTPPKQDVQPTPPKPPEPKPEPPKPEPPKPEAKPEPPKPEPPPPPKPPEPTPAPVPTPKPPEPKPPEPKPEPPKQKPEDKPKKKEDDFFKSMDSALKDVDKKKSSSTPQPSPQPQSASAAKENVNSPLADATGQPTMTEKDFLRAQIEKCWNFDPGARDAGNLVVRVRILINADGTVTQSTFQGDSGRYASDPYYRAAADSARRAPLSCSPLKAPPGRPDFYKSFPDITLNFDPRSLAR